ncbi:protein split ends isoform X3 [Hermetia illucens]|nr:protein split ends isoform X3 [Hermetia illucens]
MESPYISINLDELKRLYPNLNLENVQVVSMGSGVADETQNTQQVVIIAPEESLVLNETPIQQLVTYQQPTQSTQAYIIQSTENDSGQQTAAVAQPSIYYSTEVPSDQLIQHQQVQPQQNINISHQLHQDATQQNIILQKTIGTNQQPTASLIQQPMTNQATTHQHVIMQQTPHIVLQQQPAPQQQQQTTNPIVLRQMQGNTINQSRYVYQQPQTRTVLYNTQPQATIQTNHQQHITQQQQQIQQQQQHIQQQQPQQTHPLQHQHQQIVSPSNRVSVMQQQPSQTRQLIVSSQPQIQPNLIYQTPQTQQHIQHQQTQQTNIMQQKPHPAQISPSRLVRIATPRGVTLISPNQAPKLAPFRNNSPRFSTPQSASLTTQTVTAAIASSSANTSESMTPPQATVVKQVQRRGNAARGRGGPSPRGGRGGTPVRLQAPTNSTIVQQQQTSQPQNAQPRTVQYQVNQVSTAQSQSRQNVPPLVSTPTQRIYAGVVSTTLATTPRGVITGGQAQRVIATQTPKNQSPNSVAVGAGSQQSTPRYRIPKIAANTSTNDLEESIQAVVVTKANEVNTPGSTVSTNKSSGSKTFHTTVTTYSTIESPDDDKNTGKVTIKNGPSISLIELKRQQQQQQRQQQQPQQAAHILGKAVQAVRTNATAANRAVSTSGQPSVAIQRNTTQAATATDDSKKVIRSQPQNQHIIQPMSTNKLQNPGGDTQKSARMLVILSNGEQRLITFTLPRESCTVQELLEQVGVPFTPKTSIQCVPNPGASIDYIVTVGISVQESVTELASAAENSLQLSKQQQEASTQQNATNAEQSAQTNQNNSSEKQTAETSKEVPAKLIPGFLAVCTQCGYTGSDFAKCERCKRVFTEEPKRVATKSVAKSEDEKKKTPAELLSRAAAKGTLAVSASGLPPLRAGKVTITASTRGRGRGIPRVKPPEAEPVILTLSSDEEGDEDKSNKSAKTQLAAPSPPVLKPPLACEPVILENMPAPANMEREDVGNITNSTDQLYTLINCKIIRFGTYRYDPKEKVLLSSKGIKIIAPSCKNPVDAVVLNIQMREIVKIIAHFSKSLNILFIYTLPTCGIYIRENLEMKSKSSDTPYYNPTDRAEPYKRIVLQMDVISEEAKTVIRSIFAKTMLEEVQCTEANELLVRSCLKDKYIKQDQNAAVKSETENIRQILIYPPGKGGIPINTEDYMCLAIDQYLNDVIIDFFLKYLHTDVLTEEQRQKTHIFSSFFYNRLTTMTTRQRQTEKDGKLTASQKRHARVKSWTKNVNLFDKDFIIIPINEQSHWFLAIICFPRLQGPVTYDTHEPVVNQPTVKKKKPPVERKVSLQIGNTTITPLSKREVDSVCVGDDSLSERDEAEGDESDLASDESDGEAQNGNSSTASNADETRYRPIKQPLILIFDSLAGASRSRVVATLRDYLTCEYRAKIKEDTTHVFNKFNMPGHCVKVPQQNNFTDCGLYVLQYVEQFFKDPIKDYKLPIKQLVSWFETIVVTRKREDISNLLKSLVEQHNPDRLPLPEIQFPTLNGKLIEPELTDEQAEFEEEEMDDEGEEEEEEELDSLAGGDTEGEASPVKRNGEKRPIAIASSTTTATTASTNTITLKRPLDLELSKSQEPVVRKTARLNESN